MKITTTYLLRFRVRVKIVVMSCNGEFGCFILRPRSVRKCGFCSDVQYVCLATRRCELNSMNVCFLQLYLTSLLFLLEYLTYDWGRVFIKFVSSNFEFLSLLGAKVNFPFY